jgi:Ser/Thr protein kinase RdoA (MazF antagonist)
MRHWVSQCRLAFVTVGVEAAIRVATELGMNLGEPVLIQETNHTVVWLRPYPIIAKVGTRRDSAAALHHEHEVASALTRGGAPVAAPQPGIGPLLDRESGFVITLWTRLEVDPKLRLEEADRGTSLRLVHQALARIDVELPNFRVSLERTRIALFDDIQMAALPMQDRLFLREAFGELMGNLEGLAFPELAIHGEPHSGNCLATREGSRWIDFEDACRGPVEWDLAFLTEEARATFENIDLPLLELLMTLNSARVATWCWVQARFPAMRSHGQQHLSLVRARWPRD